MLNQNQYVASTYYVNNIPYEPDPKMSPNLNLPSTQTGTLSMVYTIVEKYNTTESLRQVRHNKKNTQLPHLYFSLNWLKLA